MDRDSLATFGFSFTGWVDILVTLSNFTDSNIGCFLGTRS